MLTLPFRFTAVLLGSLVLSIVLECIGMVAIWPEQGWRHAQSMLSYELGQLSENFTRSVLLQEPGRTTGGWIAVAYQGVLVDTGLAQRIQDASAQANEGLRRPHRDFQYYLSLVYVHVESYLIASAYMVLVFWVRLLVLYLSLPVFLTAAMVGLVDGLVRRDIRRFGAGRESGYVYHRAKACLIPVAVSPWIIYLALPGSVSPLLVALPGAVLLGVIIDIIAGSFKKHI
jgi:integrating conjugative element membrane protein (TIGR03747 family)